MKSKIKNKVIVVILRRGVPELDWILPALVEASKYYKIFLVFNSEKIYKSVYSNTFFYKFIIKHKFKSYVFSKYENFVWKILNKIYSNFKIEKLTPKLKDFLIFKVHNPNLVQNKVKKIFKKNNLKISFIFSEHGVNSGWVYSFKKLSGDHTIVHFPSSPLIYGYKSKELAPPKSRLLGDYLLIGNKIENKIWSQKISHNKILKIGFPKYDKIWRNKLNNNSKKKKNTFNVLFPYSSIFNLVDESTSKRLEKDLFDILKIILSLPNSLIYFKIHPLKNDPKYLEIISKFPKGRIIVTNDHLMKLSQISDLAVCTNQSASILDAMIYKIPSIEFWAD